MRCPSRRRDDRTRADAPVDRPTLLPFAILPRKTPGPLAMNIQSVLHPSHRGACSEMSAGTSAAPVSPPCASGLSDRSMSYHAGRQFDAAIAMNPENRPGWSAARWQPDAPGPGAAHEKQRQHFLEEAQVLHQFEDVAHHLRAADLDQPEDVVKPGFREGAPESRQSVRVGHEAEPAGDLPGRMPANAPVSKSRWCFPASIFSMIVSERRRPSRIRSGRQGSDGVTGIVAARPFAVLV